MLFYTCLFFVPERSHEILPKVTHKIQAEYTCSYLREVKVPTSVRRAFVLPKHLSKRFDLFTFAQGIGVSHAGHPSFLFVFHMRSVN